MLTLEVVTSLSVCVLFIAGLYVLHELCILMRNKTNDDADDDDDDYDSLHNTLV